MEKAPKTNGENKKTSSGERSEANYCICIGRLFCLPFFIDIRWILLQLKFKRLRKDSNV
jgi:hypothetical protein